MTTPRTPRNPRNNLPAGQSPQERGRQKLATVLMWLYSWHTTVSPLVTELIATTETTYLRELEKKGYVKSFPAPRLLCGRAYMLTRDGVNAAASALGKELPYSTHPSSVSHSLLKHNLAVQRFAIDAYHKGFQVDPCQKSAERNGKIPDAFIETANGRFAVEIELEGKWHSELEQALNRHVNAISRGEWLGVVYVSNSTRLLRRYKKQLEAPIPDWWQPISTGAVKWIRGEPRPIELEMRENFYWMHTPELLKKFEQITC